MPGLLSLRSRWDDQSPAQQKNPNLAFVEQYAENPYTALLNGASRAHESADMGYRASTGMPSRAQAVAQLAKERNPYAAIESDIGFAKENFPGVFAQPAQAAPIEMPNAPQAPRMESFAEWGGRRYPQLSGRSVGKDEYENLFNQYLAEQSAALKLYELQGRMYGTEVDAAGLQAAGGRGRGSAADPLKRVMDVLGYVTEAREAATPEPEKKPVGKERFWDKAAELFEAGDEAGAAKVLSMIGPRGNKNLEQALVEAIKAEDEELIDKLVKYKASWTASNSGTDYRTELATLSEGVRSIVQLYGLGIIDDDLVESTLRLFIGKMRERARLFPTALERREGREAKPLAK